MTSMKDRLARIRPHMFLDPHYWRKAVGLMRRPRGDSVEVVATGLDGSHSSVGLQSHETRPFHGIRVLYVASRFDYGDPSRGLSYEETAFADSLECGGAELIRFDLDATARDRGSAFAAEVFREALHWHQPDIVLVVPFLELLDPEMLREAKASQTAPIVAWFGDDQWRFKSFTAKTAPFFDWCVTTDQGSVGEYRRIGQRRVIASQWGVNTRLFRPRHSTKDIDVSFIGQPYGDRARYLDTLRSAGVSVAVYGFSSVGGRLPLSRMVEIIGRSKISLSFSGCSTPGVKQIKARNFEIPACRTLQLAQGVEGLKDYFVPGEEIVLFEDPDELVRLTKRILADSSTRNAIAEAGFQRVNADHTYSNRLRQIFRIVLGVEMGTSAGVP
jgi:spore maturation protein CgeB